MTKKIFSVVIALAFTILMMSPSFSSIKAAAEEKDYSYLRGTEINVYNWGEYISDGSEGTLDVNKEFEEETGIKVNYTTYDSNENMYNKIKGGGANYDIIIPSDYMIERMVDENLLEKIDFSNIPNYKNIMDKYKNLYFDPNNEYSVPYNVGMVGLIYNTKMVEGTPDSWSVMWDEKYAGEILMFNNSRDAFGIAQCLLGIDLNTNNSEDWHRAYDKLKEQKHVVQSYVMDDVFNKMEGGEAAIAAYYAGDYLSMAENNPDLAFVYPKEGTNIFVDSICIPTGCQNKEAAELYINYLLREDVAVQNAEFLCYATPNQAVLDDPDYSLRDEKILYPDEEDMPKTQYYHNLPQGTLTLMTSLWDNLKIEENSSDKGVYIGLISFSVIVVAYAVYHTIKKKKRESMY
jgi:spermidine/putrescine transport system substrate-binding protein